MAKIPKDTSEIIVKREYVDPDYAKRILEYNIDNRNYDDDHANEYAQYMRSGDWHTTGDANVKLTKDRRVLDGQHTLNAIRKTRVGMWLFIAYNVPDKVFPYLDNGKRRTIGDFLKMKKFPNAVTLGATIRLIIRYQHGRVPSKGHGNDNRMIVSNSTILDFADAHRTALIDFVVDAHHTHASFFYVVPSNIAFLSFIFTAKHKALCNEFFDCFATGVDSEGEKLDKTHPIAVVRAKIMQDEREKKYSRVDKLALIIYAWNLIREGKRKDAVIALKEGYTFPKAK